MINESPERFNQNKIFEELVIKYCLLVAMIMKEVIIMIIGFSMHSCQQKGKYKF